MGQLSEILAIARSRAASANLPYAGAVTPLEAAALLDLAPGARIVDVRSHPELMFVGRIPGAAEIEWALYPKMERNVHFLAHLRQQVDPEALLLFICRSGHRSHHAAVAASAAGFAECYNVLEGFEGDRDAAQHRNVVGGWRRAGLPWYQS